SGSFRLAPFHAGEISLQRWLETPAGQTWFNRMSDDSFIREVNEQMRQDRARALWQRFGPVLIVAAILVVLGTAAFVVYEYWTERQASRSGDEFLQALTLANSGQNDEALAALKAMEADSYGAYPVLAHMRAATVL